MAGVGIECFKTQIDGLFMLRVAISIHAAAFATTQDSGSNS
jgi:hypothetical protein